MKIATWNVNGIRARQDEVADVRGTRAARRAVPAGDQGDARPHSQDGRASCPATGATGTAPRVTRASRCIVRQRAGGRPADVRSPRLRLDTRIAAVRVGGVLVASIYVPNGGKDFAGQGALSRGDGGVRRRRCARPAIASSCAATSTSRARRRDVQPGNAMIASSASAPRSARCSSACSIAAACTTSGASPIRDNDALFTWWAPWRNMRQRNIGWRLDYVLASAGWRRPTSALRVDARVRHQRPRARRGDVRRRARHHDHRLRLRRHADPRRRHDVHLGQVPALRLAREAAAADLRGALDAARA